MMEIKWKDEYSVGVKEIDDQHRYFIDLLNILVGALRKNESFEKLEILFADLADYAKEHFATEEKYFDKFNFEGAEEHRLKHQEMWEDIEDIKAMKDKDQKDFHESVVFFLTEWLDDHLEEMDQEYKGCFAVHGLC